MSHPSDRFKEIVLVGGGHAHVIVLRAFGRRPEPGVRLTLVAPDLETPYSGMLPGYVAGSYAYDEIHVDLVRLTQAAGARLVRGEAVGFDREGRRVLLAGGGSIGYDVLSIDIGITPDLSRIAGAREHALAVKPIGKFIDRWERLKAEALTGAGPRRIAIVGGGVAGVCLAFAVAARLRREAALRRLDPNGFSVMLVSAGPVVPELNARIRRAVGRALACRSIPVLAGDPAAAVEPGSLILASGRRIAIDAALVSTEAAPPPAFAGAGFPEDDRGFLAVRPTLQLLDDDDVFAAGDCATMVDHPRPKAGVFAVRQGLPLATNLRRRARGKLPKPLIPQRRHLVLISTGDGRAIGGRGCWLKIEGRYVWRLKDWIDRRFMRRFR